MKFENGWLTVGKTAIRSSDIKQWRVRHKSVPPRLEGLGYSDHYYVECFDSIRWTMVSLHRSLSAAEDAMDSYITRTAKETT